MKRILIINGHPQKTSLNNAIATSYHDGAIASGSEVRLRHITDMPLEKYVRYEHFSNNPVGKEIKDAQADVAWADHIVFVHPVWWGGTPALLKLYVDMVFSAGFAFKYIKGKIMPEQLLKNKTARIISTGDTPSFIYRYFFGAPSVNQLKSRTLAFCGIKPTSITHFGPIRTADKSKIQSFLDTAKQLAEKDSK
jgi:NAD(P)H dehydrogenase (quinone)